MAEIEEMAAKLEAENASSASSPPELPEHTESLLMALHGEFYSGPKAHADAFRILPKVVAVLKHHGAIPAENDEVRGVIQRQRICLKCGGDGLEEIQNGPYFRKCTLCNGTGYRPNIKEQR